MALAGTRLGAHYRWHRARDLRARCPLAPGGSAVMSRNGFTLIELLIVVVIIGLLARSEEHTSELQSLAYIVCRLLLEKKNSSLVVASGAFRNFSNRAWKIRLL